MPAPERGLTWERRDALLADARRLRDRYLDPQACGQAAAALAILQRHGVDGLRAALDRDLPAGGTAAPWQRLRTVLRVYVRSGAWQGPEELAFVLGWLRRLGKIHPPSTRAGR
jgi:hypothetical protein